MWQAILCFLGYHAWTPTRRFRLTGASLFVVWVCRCQQRTTKPEGEHP